MARIRTVKPSFFRHTGLYDLEQDTGLPIRIAFAGLWTAADREGRFVWDARALKLDCLPHDNLDFSRVLDALVTRGFIVKYASNSRDFGFIPSWTKHQIINNRETASELPEPPRQIVIIDELTRAPRVLDACPTLLSLAQAERKGREQEGERKNLDTEINLSVVGGASKNARASRLPPDWSPSDQLAAWFKSERPDLNFNAVTAQFCDFWHSKSGKDATKIDWDKTFKVWARKERATNGFGGSHRPKPKFIQPG